MVYISSCSLSMHICLIIRFLFKVWFCVFSVLHVRYFKELFFRCWKEPWHLNTMMLSGRRRRQILHKLKEGWQPFGSPVAITPYTLMQAIAAEGDVVVSGATEPE